MARTRGRLTVVLAVITAGALALSAAPSAAVDPPSRGLALAGQHGAGQHGAGHDGGTEAIVVPRDTDRVRAYWTQARREAAVARDLAPDGSVLPAAAAGRSGAAPPAARGAGTPRTAGKLFFTSRSGDGVCSASAVSTPARNAIITAAHCVHSGPGGILSPAEYFTDFLFVPRYDRGSAPDGSWVGTGVAVHRAWVEDGDLALDQALITVAPRAGRNLVDVVGGNGLAWGYPVAESGVRIVGWPAQAPYDGETAQQCAGSTSAFDGSGDAQLPCGLNGGASGGPWFLRMLGADVGFVWAITSRRTTTGPRYLVAHPLTAAIQTLLAAVGGGDRPLAPRAAKPRRPRLSASATTVGRGERYTLRVRARPGTRLVLQTRVAAGRPWVRVRGVRTDAAGTALVAVTGATPGTPRYRVKVRRSPRVSAVVRVSVRACPLPPARSAAVVAGLRCTAPVGPR